MHKLISILFLLLMWTQPANSNGVTHPLTVRHHSEVQLNEADVEQILKDASKLLKRCNVTVTLRGSIEVFASPTAPAVISNEADLEAVHSENGEVKVVKAIRFCRRKGHFSGCAWRRYGRPSMIVTHSDETADIRDLLWAHEFGHATGLQHRLDDRSALMTPCALFYNNVHITEKECRCFRLGIEGCKIPTNYIKCPRSCGVGASCQIDLPNLSDALDAPCHEARRRRVVTAHASYPHGWMRTSRLRAQPLPAQRVPYTFSLTIPRSNA